MCLIINNYFYAISFRYDYLLQSSRVLIIPVIKCDDKVTVIKKEFIEKIDHSNDHQLLKTE